MFTVTRRTPEGWLECRGQILRIEEYPVLFAAIGSEFGGDGRTTFGIPRIPTDGNGVRSVIFVGETSVQSRPAT
jgi:microcystin-dependent protein